MKKTLLLLSLTCGFVLPAITHADTPITKNDKVTIRPLVATKHVHDPKKVIYYITDTARTGSAIPMVYRYYNGRIDSACAAAVYGQRDINRTGAIDVATELTKFDPSFSIVSPHRF